MRAGFAGASLVIAALGLSACSEHPVVDSCQDSLTGVWWAVDGGTDQRARSGERLAFHLLDRGERIEVYPMFDDSRAPVGPSAAGGDGSVWTPGMFRIDRLGGALVGERIVRVHHAGQECTLTAQAAIRDCRSGRIELSWTDIVQVDWPTCSPVSATRFTRVRLRRHWP